MKKWLLLLTLLTPSVVRAELVTPNFTQGSMQSTTTTTQEIVETIETTTYGSALNTWHGENIVETIQTNVYGGDYSSWTGHNITPSGHINAVGTTFDITTPGTNFQLEIVTRPAGIIEVTDISRTIDTVSTTTSLSVFSQ